jgi:hypothetical protein
VGSFGYLGDVIASFTECKVNEKEIFRNSHA